MTTHSLIHCSVAVSGAAAEFMNELSCTVLTTDTDTAANTDSDTAADS